MPDTRDEGMDDDTASLINKFRQDSTRKQAFELISNGGATTRELLSRTGLNHDELAPLLESALEQELMERTEEDRFELTDWGERAEEFVSQVDWNPSSLNTKKGRTFNVLSDCEWHCSECELSGSQPAAYIRDFTDEGFEFVSKSGAGAVDRRHCESCGEITTHRKMKYPFPSAKPITRQEMPESFKQRVRDLYDNQDAFNLSSPGGTPEVDHRKPRIRWSESEDFDYENMTDAEVRENFQILSSKNNLLKSRKCEACVETGNRPKFHGIDFYYAGGEKYEEDIGCEGCGWYNAHKWRRELNNLISET